MKEERIFDGITDIRDDIIERTEKYEFKKKPKSAWIKWGAVAACGCLAVGLGGKFVLDNIGGSAGGGGSIPEAGFGSEENSISYMSYQGPVLPLGAMTEIEGITAERNINFDFSPYKTYTESYEYNGEVYTYENHNSESIVTDGYTLTNSTENDITAELVYSFAGDFRSKATEIPTISVNSTKIETEIFAGKYIGGFTGVYGGNDDTERLNLKSIDGWTGYEAVLSDNSYRNEAFSDYPGLNQNVIVYKLTDIAYNGNDENATNPTLSLEFSHSKNTTVMTYGSTGGRYDPNGGWQHRSYNIPESFQPDYGEAKYLIVLGDDVTDLKIQGYQDGGCDPGEEIEGVTADIERYEAVLGDIVYEIFIKDRSHLNPEHNEESEIIDLISDELLFRCFSHTMYDYGLLSDSPAERYRWGDLTDIWIETLVMERVMYLTFEVTIPANGSVDIVAEMVKEASIDFIGENINRNGYDMMTTLASNLDFLSQSASISNTDNIEIIRQNFGFDIEKDVTRVNLDINNPHYYIEVCYLK